MSVTSTSAHTAHQPETEWLVNQIAHALRNPIFAALVQSESISMRASQDPRLAKSATTLYGQLKRLEGQIDEMLLYGRPAPISPEPVDAAALVLEVVEAYRRGGRHEPAEVRGPDPAPVPATWDGGAVRVILERLLDNAVEHTQPPHRVEVEVHGDEADRLTVVVRDHGEGIPEEMAEQIFLPFFPQHRGRPGLGLAVALKFASAMGGMLEITSAVGQGTEARCTLPRHLSGGR